jgi:hypothetical protein
LIRETDFAFKQAFAFCPYSPEAVFHYINFLLGLAQIEEAGGHLDRAGHYLDDAILIGETCQKLDPYNDDVSRLVKGVKLYRSQLPASSQPLAEPDRSRQGRP